MTYRGAIFGALVGLTKDDPRHKLLVFTLWMSLEEEELAPQWPAGPIHSGSPLRTVCEEYTS